MIAVWLLRDPSLASPLQNKIPGRQKLLPYLVRPPVCLFIRSSASIDRDYCVFTGMARAGPERFASAGCAARMVLPVPCHGAASASHPARMAAVQDVILHHTRKAISASRWRNRNVIVLHHHVISPSGAQLVIFTPSATAATCTPRHYTLI